MPKAMTTKERMLAVVRGEGHDRVPFVQYSDIGGPNAEVWAVIGRENMGILRWQELFRYERPNCRWESDEFLEGERRGFRTTIHTPVGSLTQTVVRQPNLGVPAVREHYIKEPEDYEVLLYVLKDTIIRDTIADIERYNAELGDNGLCHVTVERTPYQCLWIYWVSLLDLALHLADCPDILSAVVEEMVRIEREIFQIVARAPLHYIVIPDNITAPAIGERYFRQYCLPLYQELVGIADEKGIPVYAHLDGDLKPLWKVIGESGIKGIDSFSPPPDNDTSPAQALEMWPYMRLDLNFPSSVHLQEPASIYEVAMGILEQVGHSGRLQIQISENPPPDRWRMSYPEIVRAIRDFGPVKP
jgi:hypothetical protein